MMNAATRVNTQSAYTAVPKTTAAFWSLPSFMVMTLLVLVFLSAFSVIYIRDYQRELVTDLQGMHMSYDNMLTERSQLLLEQAAFSTQTHIQSVATQKLSMNFPQQQAIITVG